MIAESQPNVLLMVWDTARLDYAKRYASNLMDFAGSGIWFENAIATANWTNGSHSSMFSGDYPHEHGVTQSGYMPTKTDLFAKLRDSGYYRYTVSSNNHFTHRTEFTDSIDEHYYTRNPRFFYDGMDAFDFAYSKGFDSKFNAFRLTLQKCWTENAKLRSTANILPLIGRQIAESYVPCLQRVPSSTFNSYVNHNRQLRRDKKWLTEIISSEANSKRPFFLFTNTTHLHYPYVPSEQYQREHLNDVLSYTEIKRLNEEVAQNLVFEEAVTADDVDEQDVEIIRKLYAASMKEVDDYLGDIIDSLKDNGVYDETLVIVVSDHGEDLGETDYSGRRRFGHGASISDNVCRVPLAISHPNLDNETINEPFSLKELYSVIQGASDPKQQLRTRDIADLSSEYVLSQFPALGGAESFRENNPDLREAFVKRARIKNLIAVYGREWRVVGGSEGKRAAFFRGERANESDVPEEALDCYHNGINQLEEYSQDSLSEESIRHLEDMGYI